MTHDELIEDYLLDAVLENPDIEEADLLRDKKLDDDWIAQQEKEAYIEAFGDKTKTKTPKSLNNLPNKEDFEDVVVEERKG